MIDLEEILRVASDYDGRKENARKLETESFGGATEERVRYLASLKSGEAAKAFEALRPLVELVRELEIVEELLARNIADTACCPLCLLEDCPQYGKGDLGMGAFEPEYVDREQCKKSIIAHARKYAKEFAHGQRTTVTPERP